MDKSRLKKVGLKIDSTKGTPSHPLTPFPMLDFNDITWRIALVLMVLSAIVSGAALYQLCISYIS